MCCSNCGKTLAPDASVCLYCKNPVGESRFEGTPYTSAQKHILPGEKYSFVDMVGGAKPAETQSEVAETAPEAVEGENNQAAEETAAPAEAESPIRAAAEGWEMPTYTRTTYTTMEDSQVESGDVDTRTTYRPVFDNASGPEEMHRDLRAILTDPEEEEEEAPAAEPEYLSDEAINTLNEVYAELRMEDTREPDLEARPIKSTGRAGISSDVADYIQRLEAGKQRRSLRKKRVYEEDEEITYTAPEEEAAYEEPEEIDPEIDTEQSEVFDDINEEEFEELRYGRVLGVKDVLKFSLIIIVAAALFVGGFLWFRNFRDNQSSAPIEGVSETLYDEGIALLKSHASSDHINEMLALFSKEGLINMTMKLQEDGNALDALMPAEPALNDTLFVSALQAIQSNIGNATIMDANAITQGGANAVAESDARWKLVNDSIAQLEAASTATHLTGIINGEQIDVTVTDNKAATPTPAPTYTPLTRGDKSDAVLDMQNRLYQLGYLLEDRDGDYGSKTQTAIKRFQTDAGLEVTGIADSKTLEILYSDSAPMTEYAQITPSPEPTATPDPNAAE